MNETAIVYIVHSDLDENNIFAMFEDEVEAIMYARRHKEDLTYVDKTEMSLDESGDYDEVLSAETIWVYDEEDDELSDEEIEKLIQADEDEKWAEADLGDTTWFEDFDADSLVETLEENEDIVECKECFELFPKQDCFKIEIGYVCPECGKVHGCCMDDEEEFEIDSIPDVVIADEDTFKIDFPEVERMNYGNDMIPDEPTPEVENDPISEPECVEPECEAPVEAPVTKEETITKLVVDEHEAIDGYEKAKIEIEANSELDEKEKEEILDTIEHIKEEEIEHIEELEELVDEVEETKADEPAEESESEDESEVLVEAYADIDYNDVKHLDRIVARARRYKGKPRKLSAESLAWVFRESTLKHLLNGLADCNSLEDVEKKLDPYFDYLPNSIYNSGIEAYDEIVSVLPEALWELKTGIPVDKEGLDEKLINNNSEVLVEGSGFLGKVILDDYFKKDGQRNPENKNGTGYWVDLIDPDTKQSIIKPEDKKTVQKLKEAETIATHLSKAEAGWAIIRVEGAQGWNGILEVYEKGKRTQDVTQKKLANLNKAWDEQEAKKKARQALDKKLGKDKKDSDSIDLPGNNEQQPNENQNTTDVNNNQENQDENNTDQTNNDQEVVNNSEVVDTNVTSKKPKNAAAVQATKEYKKIIAVLKKLGIAGAELEKFIQGKKPTDALKELRKLLFTESLEEHVNEEHPAVESDQKLVGTDNAVVDCKVNKVITHSEDEKPVDCKGEKKPLEKSLTEITHAQYAKPEGNRVQAFNNALKYAKKENKPFIYGYTNHTGKFFAAEIPMKVTGSPAEAEKEFRSRYKNCSVIYVVYPDKDFVESLEEASYRGFAYYEYPVGSKCHVRETPTSFVATNENGTTIGESRTKIGAEGIIDEYLKTSIKEGLFTKAEQEEYNMDEDGNSLDSYDTYVRCGFCDEIYTKSECKYERNLGWLCPRCEAAIYSRGEKLTFVDPDEFLD